jgi:hypothetical protein
MEEGNIVMFRIIFMFRVFKLHNKENHNLYLLQIMIVNGHQIKKGEFRGGFKQLWSKCLCRRDLCGDLDVECRILLKQILKEQCGIGD